ncbi:hypothetical protein BGX38DRAFT_1158472 [Terfezia claveryi]|nr:hypothetical protein BGX38DRAFT_1158472 [Terfezia claveryi]
MVTHYPWSSTELVILLVLIRWTASVKLYNPLTSGVTLHCASATVELVLLHDSCQRTFQFKRASYAYKTPEVHAFLMQFTHIAMHNHYIYPIVE